MKLWTLVASAFLHVGIFSLLSLTAYQEARFGIQSGSCSVEVELVAAPAAAGPEIEHTPDLPDPPPLVEEDPMIAPSPLPQPIMARPSLPPPPSPVLRTPTTLARTGDGSSPVPGTDTTTRRSDGGAQDGLAHPNYLRNPPPPYPEQARRLHQQGLVKVRVRVTQDGRAESVEIECSSGWPLLDQAALRAIKSWRFHPARIGGIPMASNVTVPIRFELASSHP